MLNYFMFIIWIRHSLQASIASTHRHVHVQIVVLGSFLHYSWFFSLFFNSTYPVILGIAKLYLGIAKFKYRIKISLRQFYIYTCIPCICIIPPCKTQQRQETFLFLVQHLPRTGCHNPQSWVACWNIQDCWFLVQLLIYEICQVHLWHNLQHVESGQYVVLRAW